MDKKKFKSKIEPTNKDDNILLIGKNTNQNQLFLLAFEEENGKEVVN